MHTLRFPLAAGLGLFVALAVFTLLWTFVSRPVDVTTAIKAPTPHFTPKVVVRPPPATRPQKVVRKPTPIVPAGLRTNDNSTDLTPVKYEPVTAGGFVPGKVLVETGSGGPLQIGQDRDPLPLVRVPPDYPPGINTEGWVKVQYSITASGSVRDPFVVDASPKGVFDAAALKAIARWRYTPKIEGGVAVERVGLQTLIRFQLEQ
jgi:periplasmic protein TonB